MSSILGYNKGTVGGTFLDEQVLKEDNINFIIANSISRAIVDHLIYYLRSFFSDVIFQYSPTSGNTTVTIYGKYPENLANTNYPAIIIYIQNNTSEQMFIGDIIRNYGNGEILYARRGDFELILDVWGRTQLEVEAVSGALIRIFDDANHDIKFLRRGFSEASYFGTLGREFDITDKIVQTVSHLDASINVRREQILIRTGFFYRIQIPKEPIDLFMGNVLIDIENDNTGTIVNITPIKRIFSQGMAISSE